MDDSDSDEDEEDYQIIQQIDAQQQKYLNDTYVSIRDFSVSIRYNNGSRVADSDAQPQGKEKVSNRATTLQMLAKGSPGAEQPKQDGPDAGEITSAMR